MMLDRAGGDAGRITTLVRFAPGGSFPPHRQCLGEEFLVLEGTVSDGKSEYTEGCYVRRPARLVQRTVSATGATIFVKLGHVPDVEGQTCINTHESSRWIVQSGRPRCPLFSGAFESVSLERLGPGETLETEAAGGVELLVLSGELLEDGRKYPCGGWLRLAPCEHSRLVAGHAGATVYLKSGHLSMPDP
jgi:anti-sigma factor ChrR (cupin superfamily)